MIVEKTLNVPIEFPDVMAFLGNGVTKPQRQEVFETIKDFVDIEVDIDFSEVENYISREATDWEKQQIFDMIEDDVDIPTDEIIGIECKPHNLLDEMALEKVQSFIELHGIQALADKI